MRALVTGASGMLGSYLVERLMDDGWAVRALTRPTTRARADDRVEHAVGDLSDAAAIGAAAHGCDAIFHAAAAISPRGGGWEAYRAPNVQGTRHVVEAAAASGARLLHVSSVAVYGGAARYGDRPTDEGAPLAALPDDAWYARSKREAEAVVLEAHRQGRIWAAAVRPCVIYGRRDRQFVPRAARLLRWGVAPVVGRGASTLAIVHAANVADLCVRAVRHDAAGGQAYNAANDGAITVRAFAELAGEGLGRRVRVVPLPRALAAAGVGAARLALRLTRGAGAAALAAGSLDFVTRDNPFSSARARAELGWVPAMTPQAGVPDAFRWWRAAHAGA